MGEALDTTGLALDVYYEGQTQPERVTEGFTVTGYNADTLGEQTLTVTYSGKTATYTVDVYAVQILWGDVDGDGKITSTDARLTLQVYAGKISGDSLNTAAADVDGDNKITSTDARLILQYYAGKIKSFPRMSA